MVWSHIQLLFNTPIQGKFWIVGAVCKVRVSQVLDELSILHFTYLIIFTMILLWPTLTSHRIHNPSHNQIIYTLTFLPMLLRGMHSSFFPSTLWMAPDFITESISFLWARVTSAYCWIPLLGESQMILMASTVPYWPKYWCKLIGFMSGVKPLTHIWRLTWKLLKIRWHKMVCLIQARLHLLYIQGYFYSLIYLQGVCSPSHTPLPKKWKIIVKLFVL